MIQAFKRLWNDKRGNMLVIAGAAMPLLVGSAGLATDTIQWTLWKRQLQRAADSAALAGVYQRVQLGGQSEVELAVTRDLQINNHTNKDAMLSGYPVVTLIADSGVMRQQVNVLLKLQQPLTFSSMFMSAPPIITANARAASVPGTDEYCVVSLEHTTKTGITGSGNASIEMDCGMITNSPATNSAIAKGSAVMKASVIASVGGIQASSNWQVGKYDPYVAALTDPYINVVPTPPTSCGGQLAVNANNTLNATPGCYSSLSVGSNGTMNLAPGTYYVNGGNVNVQGALSGTGVTIVLTNNSTSPTATIGTFDMNASAVMNISAPTSGQYAGIAVYQDRRAVDSGGASPNKINGNSTSMTTGSIYFPKQELAYNGNGTTSAICTRFVTRRIIFTGNNTTSNKFARDCPGSGVAPIEGGRRVRLVV